MRRVLFGASAILWFPLLMAGGVLYAVGWAANWLGCWLHDVCLPD